MYNSLAILVLKVLREKGEKDVVGKKRLVSAFLDSKSKITTHWLFLKASRVTFKACSSILLV
jgi:hypothetical protein